MSGCNETVDIEDLVLGTIDAARAQQLTAHLESCLACRHERRLVTEERALFARREEVIVPPLPAFAEQLRLRLASEPARPRPSTTGTWIGPARRGLTRLVRRARHASSFAQRHGHAPLAFAAAIFCLVGMSRLGGAPVLSTSNDGVVAEHATLASLLPRSAPELLACSDPSLEPALVSRMPAASFSVSTSLPGSATKTPLASEHLACGRDSAHEFCAAP